MESAPLLGLSAGIEPRKGAGGWGLAFDLLCGAVPGLSGCITLISWAFLGDFAQFWFWLGWSEEFIMLMR